MKHWIFVLLIPIIGNVRLRAADDLIAVAQKTGQCRTFVKMIQAAGLTQTIKDYGSLTVFAPNDDAFAKLPKDVLEELMKPVNKTKLAGVVLAHLVKGKMKTADAKTTTVTTVGNSRIHLAREGSSLTYGDANLVKPDLVASNGVLHLIDKVVLPEQEEPPSEKKEREIARPPRATGAAPNATSILLHLAPQRRDLGSLS
jgi:transforming growth factor-beta-induced protein